MTNTTYKNTKSGKVFIGLFFITIGCILTLDRLGANLPHWVISWPMILIAIGVYLGVKNQFKRPAPVILIIIGSLLLVDDIVPNLDLSDLVWPVILICIGGFMIMGRNKKSWKDQWKDSVNDFNWNKKASEKAAEAGMGYAGDEPVDTAFSSSTTSSHGFSGEDFIDSVTIFGAVKKNITSKTFKGGDIVNFMGGAEINLTQADFAGRITIDITQVFGGTKIIIPPHWQIHSETAAIFGGIEDKRPIHADMSRDKELIIKGTTIFGGIDIRSF